MFCLKKNKSPTSKTDDDRVLKAQGTTQSAKNPASCDTSSEIPEIDISTELVSVVENYNAKEIVENQNKIAKYEKIAKIDQEFRIFLREEEKNMKVTSVLIADDIEQECVDILKQNGINVTVQTKQTKEQLFVSLPQHDAVIVRSATKITADLLDASAGKLKIVGRAGTGVDNIDVTAASINKVLVINTPQANSRSAAELTCILILSLSRHVPQAAESMRAGKWQRKDFMGEEVYGRTLAVIGLGRIGTKVAVRLQAFGMRVIGYDPMITKEAAAAKNIELLSLEEIWPQADYITVHVPLILQTANLINKEVLAKCKQGVRVINVSRGGIVNEQDLVESLNAGHAKGAAFDVFEQEPPTYRELVNHPLVISTPHLGASTIDAQLRVASEIAENLVQYNKNNIIGAINLKAVQP